MEHRVRRLGPVLHQQHVSRYRDFSGVAEDNELLSYGTQSSASPILGTYNVASNGYGSLTITATTPHNWETSVSWVFI